MSKLEHFVDTKVREDMLRPRANIPTGFINYLDMFKQGKLSDEYWDSLDLYQKIDLVRERLGYQPKHRTAFRTGLRMLVRGQEPPQKSKAHVIWFSFQPLYEEFEEEYNYE